MWWWIGLATASVLEPSVTVQWKGQLGTLEVLPPLGVEVAEDAPAHVAIQYGQHAIAWDGEGAALARGVALGGVRGQEIQGEMELSLCLKTDGTCTPTRLMIEGTVANKPAGVALLEVSTGPVGVAQPDPQPETEHAEISDDYHTDAAALAQAAFEQAATDGRRVLLDFGAVWCPPCNQMAVEVLHADPRPEALEPFHLVVLDADDPRSFALKDRYAVQGYPTVVLVEPDGTELARLEGYPGQPEMLAWLERGAALDGPEADLASTDPATMSPQQAAEVAWALVQTRHEDVSPWLERAAEAASSVDFRLARVLTEPTVGDAEWLAENAAGHAIDWVYGSREALGEDPQGRAAMRTALLADLKGASGSDASDLYYLLAEVSDPEDRPVLYGAAAATLRTVVGDDWDRNRGHLTWLATLTERSGDPDGALTLLGEAAERYEAEPTFHLTACRILLREERYEEALTWAEAGLTRSWGDNRIRMATHAAEALVALDRQEEAEALADSTLQALPEGGDLDIRTDRYRTALHEVVSPNPESVEEE